MKVGLINCDHLYLIVKQGVKKLFFDSQIIFAIIILYNRIIQIIFAIIILYNRTNFCRISSVEAAVATETI